MLSAKIVGNRMESKKPRRTTAQTETGPVMKIAMTAQTAAEVEKIPSSLAGATRFIIAEPAKRPTMKPKRCHQRKFAAVFSGVPGSRGSVKQLTNLALPPG